METLENRIESMATRPFIAPGRFRAVLRRVVSLTPVTKHFEWEVTAGGPFEFYAGQFISLEVPYNGAKRERPYSVASAPHGNGRFDLCLNRVHAGFVSNYLCDLQPSAELNFRGPHGSFILSHAADQDFVFIATGTGIAPIRGMLAEFFESFPSGASLPCDVWLLFGVRYAEAILYSEEFQALTEKYPRFHFVPTLSRPPANWKGEKGYVQQHLRRLFTGRKDFNVYICGLKAMADDVRFILNQELCLDHAHIRFEKYD